MQSWMEASQEEKQLLIENLKEVNRKLDHNLSQEATEIQGQQKGKLGFLLLNVHKTQDLRELPDEELIWSFYGR